ncbi:MAG: ribonuclease P protein component [Alistipes sp.]|nr:ribonuclease P protein component [Alistipes sp.]
MTKSYALPKSERLHSLSALRRLFTDGTSHFVYPFRYTVYSTKSTTASVEVLFSVPKRFHKRANKRNLLRRRTKEAYRLNKHLLDDYLSASCQDIDLALVYSTKDVLPYKTIENAICRILAEIAKSN